MAMQKREMSSSFFKALIVARYISVSNRRWSRSSLHYSTFFFTIGSFRLGIVHFFPFLSDGEIFATLKWSYSFGLSCCQVCQIAEKQWWA
jgi:hypothetical protein